MLQRFFSKQEQENENLTATSPQIKEGSLLDKSMDVLSSWRILKIMGEFVSGFEFLRRYGLAATFFGSARTTLPSEYYDDVHKLSSGLVKMGFAIITGGGPGIMEAANKGAYESNGQSVGINIQLPTEQRVNPYVKESSAFHYFFTRKVMLSYASEIYIYYPGGFGTLDELFEILTLVQTGKIGPMPIILVKKDFWQPLLAWIETSLAEQFKTINSEDVNIYHLVDNADEALILIEDLIKRNKLSAKPLPPEYCGEENIIR